MCARRSAIWARPFLASRTGRLVDHTMTHLQIAGSTCNSRLLSKFTPKDTTTAALSGSRNLGYPLRRCLEFTLLLRARAATLISETRVSLGKRDRELGMERSIARRDFFEWGWRCRWSVASSSEFDSF